jgi:pimeloyl-ACP methyl ester carboxylesterase
MAAVADAGRIRPRPEVERQSEVPGPLARPLEFRKRGGSLVQRRGVVAVSGLRSGSAQVAFDYMPAQAARDTFVLGHGLGSDRRSWDEVAKRLRAAGFGVLRLDWLGHGETADRTDPTGGVAWEDQVKAAEAVIDHHRLASVRLVGHSYGGGMMLALAASPSMRGRVSGVASLAGLVRPLDVANVERMTQPAYNPFAPWWTAFTVATQRMFTLPILRWQLGQLVSQENPGLSPALLERRVQGAADAVKSLDGFDARQLVRDISPEVPLQLMVAGRDELVPAWTAHELAQAARRSGHAVEVATTAAGHHLPKQAPQAVVDFLLRPLPTTS